MPSFFGHCVLYHNLIATKFERSVTCGSVGLCRTELPAGRSPTAARPHGSPWVQTGTEPGSSRGLCVNSVWPTLNLRTRRDGACWSSTLEKLWFSRPPPILHTLHPPFHCYLDDFRIYISYPKLSHLNLSCLFTSRISTLLTFFLSAARVANVEWPWEEPSWLLL